MTKHPIRIAIFTAMYAPILSGISVGVHQRARWLLQQGHQVFLIHPKIDNQYPKSVRNCTLPGLDELHSFPNFSSYAYPTKPIIFYKLVPEPLHYRHWSDTKLLEKFRPDIVIVEEAVQMRGFYSLFLGGYGRPVGTEYANRTGTPTISHVHTDILAYSQYYLGNQFLRFFRPIISNLTKRFTEAYDVNYFSSQELLAKYSAMEAQRSEYLSYQGVDCQKFHPQNICYDPIPDDQRPTLLFIGRIAREKNVTQLLDAFSLIAAKIPNVHLVIIGSGPQEEEIRRSAEKFGSDITVWGESIGTELLGWFARADLFVNPSVTENFCTTNMEALASGTPVVAARAGGNVEQIVPSRNGFLAEPNNPTDFAQKVLKILENPDLKADLTRHARSSILEFDWSACMEKFEDKLYQLVGVWKKREPDQSPCEV